MSTHENGWANPSPAGLVALAVACFIFYAYLSGKVSDNALPLMGLWLLGGFIIQFAVALIELKKKSLSGGNIFLLFSGYFMFTTGLSFIFTYYAGTQGWPLDPHIAGWTWIVLWATVWLWTPAFFNRPMVFIIMVLCLDFSCPFICLINIGVLDHAYSTIPAIALLFAGSIGFYFAAAVMLNATYNRVILPIGKPLIKPQTPPPHSVDV